MILLITGMPRSGSTWSFNVARLILEEYCPGARILSKPEPCIESILRDKGENFDYIILKFHEADQFGINFIKHDCAKTIYTYREPIDAMASWMQVFGFDFGSSLAVIKSSLQLAKEQQRSNCLFICYGDIVDDAEHQVDVIREYLGFPYRGGLAQRICDSLEKEAVRTFANNLQHDGKGTCDIGFSYYDVGTFFHRNHIRDDDAPAGKEFFSPAQQEIIRSTLKDYLDPQGHVIRFGDQAKRPVIGRVLTRINQISGLRRR